MVDGYKALTMRLQNINIPKSTVNEFLTDAFIKPMHSKVHGQCSSKCSFQYSMASAPDSFIDVICKL